MTKDRKGNRDSYRRRIAPAIASVAALATGMAGAQQAQTDAAKGKDTEQLEKITVTATKRSESLQTVPVAVTVITGELLEQQNINNVSTLTAQTPVLNFRANASNKDTSLFIRGVGTISTSPGVEPTVSTVVDGVVFARPGQATLDLMDIERVEVLRGPQGTLFGKNASAGVLNIVTRPLQAGREAFADLSYFEGNERRLRVGASGEVSQSLLGSVTAFVGKYDGNVKNTFLGEDVNGYDRKGVRGKAAFSASRDVTITVIGDYAKADDTGTRGPFVRANAAITAALAPIAIGTENRDVATDVKERVEDTNKGLSAQVDWNLGKLAVTSITAWRQWNNVQFQDIDGTAVVYNQIAQLSDRGQLESKTLSQELRAASAKGGAFDYVAGLFYMKTETDEVYRRDVVRCNGTLATLANGLTPCAANLNDNGVATYGTDGKSASVFGEANYHYSKALRGVFGLRYTRDELSYYHSRISTAAAAIPGVQPSRPYTTGSTKETGISGRVGPQYDFSEDMMGYVTYSRGYKGPAYNAFFNMTSTADLALDPEKSKGWEAGLKTTFADNRVRVNVAVFDTKYTGYQANYPDLVAGTVVTRFINAGDVSTKGVELDIDAKVTRQLSLSASVANTRARVDRFNCPVGATCPDLTNQPLPSAPDWKGVVRAGYWMRMGAFRIDLGADYSWSSKVQFDLSTSANTIQPSYSIYNASIALSQPGKGWRVALIGKNLGDKSYAAFLLPGANTQRSVPRDDERYFGVNARLDF